MFFKRAMKKGDIVGIYENYTGGPRLTSGRIKSDLHLSDYAIEYDGLVRDAWEPVRQRPCHHLGYSNDGLGQHGSTHTPRSTQTTTDDTDARCGGG